jgi:DNA-binding transcriptional regulator YhcF (GntR family)
MLVRLEPRSSDPIYLQIADSIAGHIDSGSLKAGERLPAARSLGETIGVNMHTVLKAYSELERRQLVEMRRGRAGVVVQGEVDLRRIARMLVSAAKRQKLERAEVTRLVDDVWR